MSSPAPLPPGHRTEPGIPAPHQIHTSVTEPGVPVPDAAASSSAAVQLTQPGVHAPSAASSSTATSSPIVDLPPCSSCDEAHPSSVFCAECSNGAGADLCSACDSHMHSSRLTRAHRRVSQAEKQSIVQKKREAEAKLAATKCSLKGHNSAAKDYWCEGHLELCCVHCTNSRLAGEKHSQCRVMLLHDACEKVKLELKEKLEKMGGSEKAAVQISSDPSMLRQQHQGSFMHSSCTLDSA